jgi:hypothetical protein
MRGPPPPMGSEFPGTAVYRSKLGLPLRLPWICPGFAVFIGIDFTAAWLAVGLAFKKSATGTRDERRRK